MTVKSIKEIILTNRPKLSEGSLKTYSSIINNLMKKMKLEEIDNLYKDYEDVIEFLKHKNPAQRKTIYASLIVLLDKNDKADNAVEKYRDIMMNDGKKSLEEDMSQEKNDKQADNWETWNEIIEKRTHLEKDVKLLLNKKTDLSQDEYTRVLNYLIICLYTYIPPRRLVDYTDFKIRDVNKTEDNYIDGNEFVFNKYKTKNTYGAQRVEVPKELMALIKKWMKINKDSDYLLTDASRSKKLSPQTLINRLYAIFGKKISVSMLRHIYISNVLKNMPPLTELKKLSETMGHSFTQQLLYKKV